ncbi:hypothetical protein IW140_001599 [Coemansia sp. RSA 1813]|nr:hypothetical protein IW140_001599 [Coemansia sp. RSA 1813]
MNRVEALCAAQNDFERRLYEHRKRIQHGHSVALQHLEAREIIAPVPSHEKEAVLRQHAMELERADKRAVSKLDELRYQQQMELQKLGVPGFYPSSNPAILKLQQDALKHLLNKLNGGKTAAVGSARKKTKKPKVKSEVENNQPDTTELRNLIAKHWDKYAQASRIKQQKHPYIAQIAGYEAQKIHTAFLASVKNSLGNCLRRAVNMLCRSKTEALAKRIELKAAGTSADTIRDTLRAEAKKCVERGKIVEAELDAHIYERVKELQSVLYIYENDAPSEKGLYYDIKCDPWIPCHVHIDKAILCQWFLGGIKKGQKLTNDLWGEVLDISCWAIKSKQDGKGFEGSIQTDSVSISIFKRCKAKTPKTKKGKDEDGFEFEYIGSIDQDKLCAMEGNCVLIDPGRRGLLFCMHEYSSIGNPWLFRFTRNHKAKLTRSTKFRKILEAAKKMYPDNAIIEAEKSLAEVSCTTVDPDEFKRFIEIQAEVWPLLSKFYSCTQTNSTTNRKPLHRQLRLAAYLNSQRADHVLANLTREQFGSEPALVLGNWSTGMCKYHEPIRGVGMRRMLRKHGFKVYLLDEFRTSAFCPGCCEDRLVHPEELVPNPRPYPKKNRRMLLAMDS